MSARVRGFASSLEAVELETKDALEEAGEAVIDIEASLRATVLESALTPPNLKFMFNCPIDFFAPSCKPELPATGSLDMKTLPRPTLDFLANKAGCFLTVDMSTLTGRSNTTSLRFATKTDAEASEIVPDDGLEEPVEYDLICV